MKKLVLVIALAVLLTGAVFADHPSGWAVGGGFQVGGSWSNPGLGSALTLFLKAPSLPVYWGIRVPLDFSFGTNSSFFSLGATGDFYLYDQALVPEIKLGWFLGVGAYANIFFYTVNSNSSTGFDVGVRIPVGLSFMPLDFLEIFLDLAPSIGIYSRIGSNTSEVGLGGGWQGDFGVRFWF